MATSKKVTRITAKDEAPKKTAAAKTVASKKKSSPKKVKTGVVAPSTSRRKKNIFSKMGAYFKGAWVELRQVRWPNRRATWALTLAVIVFSLFFVGLIVLLDMFFQYIFELIIA